MTRSNEEHVDVTVVVVARNEAKMIETCMKSLVAQDYEAKCIILVDDGSTDNTIELARRVHKDLKVLSSPTRSISENRNVGWRAAKTEFVAFLDADCEAPTGWLSTLMSEAKRTGAAAVGGGNLPPSTDSPHYAALALMLDTFLGSRGSIQGRVPKTGSYVNHLPTLNVLFRTEALRFADGFDTRFARMGEDEDLSHRLRNMGMTLCATPDATVIHRQRADIKSWARNMFEYGKGRTWLLRRHPNAWSPLFAAPPLILLTLPVYLPIIALYALVICFKAGKLNLGPRVFMLFVATHIPYAVGQIWGLFESGDSAAVKKKPRRVGMIALKNAGNKGDEAIVRCVSERLTAMIADTDANLDAYLIALGPSGIDTRPLPISVDARDRIILDALAPADQARLVRPTSLVTDAFRSLIVFAGFQFIFISGGQWLHDLSKAKHYAICTLFAFARLFGTQTGVFCIGVGPLTGSVSRWFLRRGFGDRSMMITRDTSSTNLIHDCGRMQALTAADPALNLPTETVQTNEKRVLISPCAWANFENIYALDANEIEASFLSWVKLVEGLRSRGHILAMLPTMNPEDQAFADRIIAATEDIACIDTQSLTPPQIQGHIAASAALISMRLHPVIFASNCGVPFVSLNYADKVRAFCQKAKMSDRLVELRSKNWAEQVLQKLELQLNAETDRDVATARSDQLEQLETAYEELSGWLEIKPAPHRAAA